MKVGRDLEALAREIKRRQAAKADYVIRTEGVTVEAQQNGDIALNLPGTAVVTLNDVAHRQVGTHTGIPAAYYDKMRREAPDLLANNIATWFRKHKSVQMLRTLDGKGRAFLSDRFRNTGLEYEDMAEAVLPVLLNRDLAIMSCEITDRKLYIKAVDKSVVRELEAIGGKFGDGQHKIVRMLSPAVTITDSEVGLGSASIMVGVYDGFCSNLATFGERSARKYHVGKRHELADEAAELFSPSTMRKTNAATIAQLADVTAAAFDRAKFDSLCNKIDATRKDEITGDVVQVVTMASRHFGLNEEEGKSVLDQLIRGGDVSRFGLYNAVTAASQNIADYDRASELERIGGDIIDLPQSEWRVLAKAA